MHLILCAWKPLEWRSVTVLVFVFNIAILLLLLLLLGVKQNLKDQHGKRFNQTKWLNAKVSIRFSFYYFLLVFDRISLNTIWIKSDFSSFFFLNMIISWVSQITSHIQTNDSLASFKHYKFIWVRSCCVLVIGKCDFLCGNLS